MSQNPLAFYRPNYNEWHDPRHIAQLKEASEDQYLLSDSSQAYTITTIYTDLMRARSFTKFQGWNYSYNPFTTMHLEAFDNYAFMPDFMEKTMKSLISDMYGWMGIGFWYVSEEYFHTALSLSFVTNNIPYSMQIGTNLGVCYLGGGDVKNAFRVSSHALSAAIQTTTSVENRLKTIQGFSLLKAGHVDKIKKGFKLDFSVYETITDIYQFLKNKEQVMIWDEEWGRLQEIVNS